MTKKEKDTTDKETSAAMLALEENLWRALALSKDKLPMIASAAICLKVALKIYKSVLSHEDVERLLAVALETTPPLLEQELPNPKVLH